MVVSESHEVPKLTKKVWSRNPSELHHATIGHSTLENLSHARTNTIKTSIKTNKSFLTLKKANNKSFAEQALLNKHNQSTWLDISLDLFIHFYGLQTHLGP